jgi:hypothetical protein
MNTELITTSVQFGIGLCLLLSIYRFFYQKTRLDTLREDLFTMRDGLFDYMWKHNISYDTPVYREMRRMLNGFISIAHKFNIGGLLLGAILTREKIKGDDFKVSLNNVTDEAFKQYLSELYSKVALRIIHFIFLEGPMWIIFKPLELAARHLPAIHLWFARQFSPLAAAAARFGGPETKQHRLGDAAVAS